MSNTELFAVRQITENQKYVHIFCLKKKNSYTISRKFDKGRDREIEEEEEEETFNVSSHKLKV